MHIKRVLFTSVCVLSLTACGLTPQEMAQIQQQRYEQTGQQQMVDLASDGKTPKQIPIEKVLPVFPRGYTAHLPKRLLKPQGAVQVAAAQPSQDDIEPAPIPPLPEVAAVTAPPAAQAVTPTPASTPAPTPSLSSQPVASPLPPVVAAAEAPVIQQEPANFIPAQPISLASAASRSEPVLTSPSPVSSPMPSSVVWREISDYNPNNFAAAADVDSPAAAPVADAAPVGRRYNKNVTVFMPDDETSYVAPSDFEPATVVISSAGTQNAGVAAPVVLTPPAAEEAQRTQQLFFSHASAVIKPGDKKELRRIAGGIKSDVSHVTVIGHASARVDHVTDPVEKKMINFRMAQKRAEAVTREMEKSGVSPDWVEAVSRGDEEPNPEAGDMTQEAADRRVDVFVTGAPGK